MIILTAKYIFSIFIIVSLCFLYIAYSIFVELSITELNTKQGVISKVECVKSGSASSYLGFDVLYHGETSIKHESIYVNAKYSCNESFEDRVRRSGSVEVTYSGNYYLRVVVGSVPIKDFDENSFFKKQSTFGFYSIIFIFVFIVF
ncbi:hypothetical protein Marme_3944 [Marinomonas mediterranea MMB-1]|jgi:hypothetical protein|uniref:Transmembrane protein n=1 Tax=Marinomonas mediterranea (strain ATCC 700492 / JCM 21426 / NBRC 103028 / MMB-1) TaxID=717774 RepID=F2JYM4_MARM1|nr:hypothetical protein Marme_3944 [Marinomonas mediterranea MMB-1]